MLITLIGLYGLTADMVANRLREIGIRRALGATDPSLLWTFARRGSSLAALGLVSGAALAYLLRHAAASVVPPIELSAVWISGGVLATLITATLASVIPASSALRVQPERILRQE
jgi:ABC-type antimicrobial peptide transport system permease subunit